jgi:sulfatase maturation enzyme AslB (radical SAM superfamily)
MSLASLLQIPELEARYRKVKKFFFLRESAYDVTSACQLRCDGCYYFAGERSEVKDDRSPEHWKALLDREKARGINYVNLAGAEPALVPRVLRACYESIPLGTIFTNGLKRIETDIPYRIQISIWGDHTGDPTYRRYANGRQGPYCLPLQLKNYRNDRRVIFVYTFNNENIGQVDEVLRAVRDEGHRITFNVFSTPVGKQSMLSVRDTLARTRDKMMDVLSAYPKTVVYSEYNAEVHTQEASLHTQFGCPYPRAAKDQRRTFGIATTFRNYRADLTDSPASCCVPHTDCADCRHYAAGSAIVTSRLDLHAQSEALFRGWLDYVDTYLAIWISGYEKDENLYRAAVAG